MDWPYLAGFFDGEGWANFSFGFNTNRTKVYVMHHLGFGSSETSQREQIINFLSSNGIKAIQYTFKTPQSKCGSQSSTVMISRWDESEVAARKLLQYAVLKRRTLELYLIGVELHRRGYVSENREEWENLRQEMKTLTAKGRKTLRPIPTDPIYV